MNWYHKISFWKYLPTWRPVLPGISKAQTASFLLSILNFQRVLKINSCSSTWFNPCRGRWQCPWQVPVFGWKAKQGTGRHPKDWQQKKVSMAGKQREKGRIWNFWSPWSVWSLLGKLESQEAKWNERELKPLRRFSCYRNTTWGRKGGRSIA